TSAILRPGELPALLAAGCVQAVHAVVARSEEDLAGRDARARFRLARRPELPELGARRRAYAVELAVLVVLEALAKVEPAIGHARRREDLLHAAVVIE